MNELKTQIGEVRYNAAEQCFEALVTFHTDAGRVRVVADFPARSQPISKPPAAGYGKRRWIAWIVPARCNPGSAPPALCPRASHDPA